MTPPIEEYSLLSAFVIGLLHVLEPCEDKAVASIYIAWAGKKMRESLMLILMYGLGMILIDASLGLLVSFMGLIYLENFQYPLRFAAALFTIVFGFLIMTKSHLFEAHCYVKTFRDVNPANKMSILTFGLIRGLPLCPIEVGMLLWAASVGNVLQGTLLVIVFSIGTMISLVPFGIGASGILTIAERRAGETMKRLVPIVVGLIIVTMGVILLVQ
ncbi:MAG: sulfite exporter TauE/SafE family protein [Candidatus Geothermarchaeales archaeon]